MTTELEPDALANCPFCSGQAEMVHGCAGCWFVRCTSCKATSDDALRDTAIHKWNRRALSAPEAAHPGAATSENVVAYIDKAGLSLLAGGKSVTVWASPFHMLDGHNSIPLSIAPSATPRPAAPTDGDIGALVKRLNAARDPLRRDNLYGAAATALADMSAKLAEVEQYARKATSTITDLVGGGSECFSGRIGEMYIADLAFCKQRIRERETRAHDSLIKAVAEKHAAEAANADLRRRVDAMWEALDDVTDDVAMLHNSVLSASIPASYKATLADRTKPIHDKLRALAARTSGGSDA